MEWAFDLSVFAEPAFLGSPVVALGTKDGFQFRLLHPTSPLLPATGEKDQEFNALSVDCGSPPAATFYSCLELQGRDVGTWKAAYADVLGVMLLPCGKSCAALKVREESCFHHLRETNQNIW